MIEQVTTLLGIMQTKVLHLSLRIKYVSFVHSEFYIHAHTCNEHGLLILLHIVGIFQVLNIGFRSVQFIIVHKIYVELHK